MRILGPIVLAQALLVASRQSHFGLCRAEHRCGRRQAEPGAAILFGDERGEIAGFGQRADKLGRVGAHFVELAPIIAGIFRAELAHARPDIGVLVVVVWAFMTRLPASDRIPEVHYHPVPPPVQAAYAGGLLWASTSFFLAHLRGVALLVVRPLGGDVVELELGVRQGNV